MRRAWAWWVGIWDRREHPLSLALVRILLAAVIAFDLIEVLRLDLVVGLFAPLEAGGMGDPLNRQNPPWLFELLPPTPQMAWLVVLLCLGSAITLLVGLGTRLSALLLLLLLAQLALVLPPADRGIDMLLRNVLLVLVLSGSGRSLSLDARLRTGSFLGTPQDRVPSWPRYLLVIQLVLLYLAAGMSKVASSWTPFGGYSALFIAMRDPAFQKLSPELLDRIYPLTQLGTAVSWTWEWGAPILLLGFWYRDTRDRPGRLRALFNRLQLVKLYLLVGAIFHLGTHFALQLGIFPFAVLALYPACFHPDELIASARRFSRGGRLPPVTATAAEDRGRMPARHPG